ncbi:hypothetical protein ACS0TY_033981 [Phlomoides rotata]
MDAMLEKVSLSVEEEDELVLEVGIENTMTSDTLEFCLVGNFLMDKSINFSLMKNRMASIWRPKKGLYVKDVGEGRYVFHFFHRMDVKRVEDGSPWSFRTYLMVLYRLDKGDQSLQVPLYRFNFWIDIYDLSLGYFSERIGQQLGNFVGRFVDFKYEKLNQFCFVCECLGHTKNFYEVVFNVPEEEEVRREWGSWLKAPDKHSLLYSGDKWIRRESGCSDGDSLVGGGSGKGDVQARASANIGAELVVARLLGGIHLYANSVEFVPESRSQYKTECA